MRILEIDGRQITSRSELHEVLARELSLPEWYGKNLDALYDCLTDMTEETQILIRYPDRLQENLGGYAEVFLRVLSEASEENPSLAIRTE